MKCLRLLLALSLLTFFVTARAAAQAPPAPTTACPNEPPLDPPSGSGPGGCDPFNTLTSGQFQATAFVDTVADGQGHYPDYGDPNHNIVSLYGVYGNNESTSSAAAQAHYTQGTTLASQIVPRCIDGTIPQGGGLCPSVNGAPPKPPATIFLFIGFSNTDIEIGGGSNDAWDNQIPGIHHLPGQPCSTLCENLNNPDGATAWNQVTTFGGDGVVQQSLIYQIYSPAVPLVGQHVVVFNGAYGGQTLDKWDPTSIGFYAQNGANCAWDHQTSSDPECNYVRVKDDLTRNGYSEAQVQAIFLKDGDSFPQCDLKNLYCGTDPLRADAYNAEIYMGDVLRYLKCCKLNPDGSSSGVARYPNIKQVFVTSRIYGGYGNGSSHGCLNPEPFAFRACCETGVRARQMMIVVAG